MRYSANLETRNFLIYEQNLYEDAFNCGYGYTANVTT